jgi:hypothetical protein
MRARATTAAENFLNRRQGFARLVPAAASNGDVVKVLSKIGVLAQVNHHGGLFAVLINNKLHTFHAEPPNSCLTSSLYLGLVLASIREN